MRNNKGFTLVEMMVVVAIIAILASVFLIGLSGFRGSAYDARRLSDLQNVQSYLEIYYNKNRTYPSATTWADLETALTGSDGAGISSIPKDPINTQSYYYSQENSGQGYIIGAKLSEPNASVLDDSYSGSVSSGQFECGKTVGIYCVKF